MYLRNALTLFTVLLLAACAGSSNVEPPAELVSFDPSVTVERAWSANVGSEVEHLRLALAPAVAEGRVYAAGRDGIVSAYEAATGSRVWRTDVGLRLSGGPGTGEGLVVAGSSNGEVVALNAGDGTERWRTRVSSEVLAAPAVGGRLVAVRTIDGTLHALDITDGTELWIHEQDTPSLALRGSAAPVIIGNTVIAGFNNGRLVACHARDGQVLWDTELGQPSGRTEVERMVDVSATPRLVGRDLYAVSYQGRLAAMSSGSGRVLWSHVFSSTAGLGVDESGVYVADANSEIHAYDRSTGADRWHQPALRARSVTAPVVHGAYVVVADFDGYLHWLSKETGAFAARDRADSSGIHAAPVVADGMLFVQGDGGTLAAYRIRD